MILAGSLWGQVENTRPASIAGIYPSLTMYNDEGE
jgi:hypothetical protein